MRIYSFLVLAAAKIMRGCCRDTPFSLPGAKIFPFTTTIIATKINTIVFLQPLILRMCALMNNLHIPHDYTVRKTWTTTTIRIC